MDGHPTYEDLSRRLDGELSPSRLEEVDAHLDKCAACRKEYETLRWIDDTVMDLPWEPPPLGLSFRLPPEERGRYARRPSLSWARVAAVGAAATVLLALGGRWYCASPPGAPRCSGAVRTALSLPADAEAPAEKVRQARPAPQVSDRRGVDRSAAVGPTRVTLTATRTLLPVVTTATPPVSETLSTATAAPVEFERKKVKSVALASTVPEEREDAGGGTERAGRSDPGPAFWATTVPATAEITPTTAGTATITPTLAVDATVTPTVVPTVAPYPPPPTASSSTALPGLGRDLRLCSKKREAHPGEVLIEGDHLCVRMLP